jgi:hypothetical protein
MALHLAHGADDHLVGQRLGHTVARDAHRQQRAHRVDVFGQRLGLAVRDQLTRHVVEHVARVLHRAVVEGLHGTDEGRAGVHQARLHVVVQVHPAAEHPHRKAAAEFTADVTRATFDQGPQILAHDLADHRFEPGHPLGREQAVQCGAVGRLLGRIEVQRRAPAGGRHLGHDVLDRGGEERVIGRGTRHIGMPGQRPEASQRIGVGHRAAAAQIGVGGLRGFQAFARDHIEVLLVKGRHQDSAVKPIFLTQTRHSALSAWIISVSADGVDEATSRPSDVAVSTRSFCSSASFR